MKKKKRRRAGVTPLGTSSSNYLRAPLCKPLPRVHYILEPPPWTSSLDYLYEPSSLRLLFSLPSRSSWDGPSSCPIAPTPMISSSYFHELDHLRRQFPNSTTLYPAIMAWWASWPKVPHPRSRTSWDSWILYASRTQSKSKDLQKISSGFKFGRIIR